MLRSHFGIVLKGEGRQGAVQTLRSYRGCRETSPAFFCLALQIDHRKNVLHPWCSGFFSFVIGQFSSVVVVPYHRHLFMFMQRVWTWSILPAFQKSRANVRANDLSADTFGQLASCVPNVEKRKEKDLWDKYLDRWPLCSRMNSHSVLLVWSHAAAGSTVGSAAQIRSSAGYLHRKTVTLTLM